MTCEFYFSKPAPLPRRSWATERWVDTLRASVERAVVLGLGWTSWSWTCLTPVHISASRRRCTTWLGRTAYDSLLSEAGRTVRGFAPRGGPRSAPRPERDARAAQAAVRSRPGSAACGGVARQVELSSPGRIRSSRRIRTLSGVVDIWRLAPPLRRAALRGQRPRPVGGALHERLLGWYQVGSAARRRSRCHRRRLGVGQGTGHRAGGPCRRADRGVRVRRSRPAELGYGSGDREISVRVTRSYIPLPGAPLPVSGVEAHLRYDAKRDEWVERSAYDAAIAELLDKVREGRRSLGRVRRRQRKLRGI